jgi:hypothetical protein
LKEEKEATKELEKAQQFIQPAEAQAGEDLFAFEYTSDEQVFQKSRDAWAKFLASMIENLKTRMFF